MFARTRCASRVCNLFRSFPPASFSQPTVTSSAIRLYADQGNKDVCKPPVTRKSPDDSNTSKTLKSGAPPLGNTGSCPPGSQEHSAQDSGKLHTLKNPSQLGSSDIGSKQSRYSKHLAVGIIFAALSAFAFYILRADAPEKEKEEEVKIGEVKKRRKPKIPVKVPLYSNEIPSKIQYLLIGGGTASFSAFRSIKSLDPTAKILVVSNESHNPYMRPPLSKEMWFNDVPHPKPLSFKQWNGTERSLFYEPHDFYTDCKKLLDEPNGGVSVVRGWSVKRIDVIERKAYLEDDHVIEYDKCLIATGSSPKNLPVFKEASPAIQEKISLYRDIFDYEEFESILKGGVKKIAIIGGGFLGSELACALARRGRNQSFHITQIFRESGNMGKVLPEYLSFWTSNKVQKEGVEVISNSEVQEVSQEGNGVLLQLSSGENVFAEHVIVAVGVEPNTELAESSNLEVDEEHGGYLVNAELMARSNLWIAGDCTCFYDTKLGRRRVEHHDHAVVSGRLAGENMTGAGKPYIHQSMFWSDLGPEVGYEAIGIVDSSLPTVGVFAKATEKDTPQSVVAATNEGDRAESEAMAKPVTPATSSPTHSGDRDDYGKGVIFYLRDDTVVGIVLWNVFNRMSIARQVLRDERRYEDLNEVAKLFNIHEDQP